MIFIVFAAFLKLTNVHAKIVIWPIIYWLDSCKLRSFKTYIWLSFLVPPRFLPGVLANKRTGLV